MVKSTIGINDWLLILLLGFIWGGSFFFNAVAVEAFHPLLVVFLRVVVAAIILWIIMLARKQVVAPTLSMWSAFIVMGCLNNAIPFLCIVWGQQHIASGLASVLNATTPLFTIVFASWLLSDESMSINKFIGVVLGVIGVVIMMGADLRTGMTASLLGQALILAAAISYAFAGIFGRRFKAMGISPMMTATGQVTGSSLLLLPLILFYEPARNISNATPAAWLSVIGLATVCTAFAYLLYFKILSAVGASNLALVTFVVPVSAIVLGGLFLQEVITRAQWLGIAVIAMSLLVIDGRWLSSKNKSAEEL